MTCHRILNSFTCISNWSIIIPMRLQCVVGLIILCQSRRLVGETPTISLAIGYYYRNMYATKIKKPMN